MFRLLRKVKRDAVAQALELVGAAGVAFGVGMVSVPAGVVVAGVAVIAWALLIFNTDGGG